ncbi:hypothetical protein FACS1894216_12090 [Synergistales bacterium]|nr:hypothetical protein FACS1894216_12090 [Synergistales bacterium]
MDKAGEVLLEAKTSMGSLGLSICSFICGLLLIGGSLYPYYASSGGISYGQLIMGAILLYSSGYRRKFYIASDGVVRRGKGWRTSHRDVLIWSKVRGVTIIFRGRSIAALFEKGITGRRLIFSPEQEDDLLSLLAKYAPNAEIEVIEK